MSSRVLIRPSPCFQAALGRRRRRRSRPHSCVVGRCSDAGERTREPRARRRFCAATAAALLRAAVLSQPVGRRTGKPSGPTVRYQRRPASLCPCGRTVERRVADSCGEAGFRKGSAAPLFFSVAGQPLLPALLIVRCSCTRARTPLAPRCQLPLSAPSRSGLAAASRFEPRALVPCSRVCVLYCFHISLYLFLSCFEHPTPLLWEGKGLQLR